MATKAELQATIDAQSANSDMSILDCFTYLKGICVVSTRIGYNSTLKLEEITEIGGDAVLHTVRAVDAGARKRLAQVDSTVKL